MMHTVRVGTVTRLWWDSPGFCGTASSGGGVIFVGPSVAYRAPSGLVTAGLTSAQMANAVVTSATRDTLTLSAPPSGSGAALGMGDAWLYTVAQGAIPVRVASISGTTVRLADRLPYDAIITGDSRLQSARWFHDVGPGAPVDAVTRTASGDAPVPYTISWGTVAPGGTTGFEGATIEGLLSVVRQPWLTGLTTAALRQLYPEVQGLPMVGEAGLGAAIKRTGEAMRLRVRGDVRERGMPGYAWEDDLSGASFLVAHATMAMASLIDATQADRAERLRAEGESLYAQALRSAWADLNRDGVVDAGESPGLTGAMLASDALASITEHNPWAVRR